MKELAIRRMGKDVLPAEMSLHDRYYREIQSWDKKMLYKVKFAFASGIGKDVLPEKKEEGRKEYPCVRRGDDVEFFEVEGF